MSFSTAKGYDTSKYNQDFVKQAQRGSQWDSNDQARYDALVKAQQQKSKPAPAPAPKPQPNPQPEPAPKPQPKSAPKPQPNPARAKAKAKAKVVQEQNVNQDNDINTNVKGNNNTVINEQDNSIRQYGGDNRSLTINESGKKGKGGYYNAADKAITMGTLGGFYDVDDSPAAQAKFVDQQQTMNRDAQKKYSNVGMTTAAKYAGFRGGDLDIKALQRRIDGNDQYFRDRATIQEVKTYGDRAAKFEYAPFEFGDPIEEVTSNADKIAKGYKDDIDDV